MEKLPTMQISNTNSDDIFAYLSHLFLKGLNVVSHSI